MFPEYALLFPGYACWMEGLDCSVGWASALPIFRVECFARKGRAMKCYGIQGMALLGLLTLATSTVAQNCKAPTTQFDMSRCASIELETADKELNRVYGSYRGRLNTQQQTQIRDVQLAWIRYRDLSCKYEASGVEGGSAHGLILSNCLARMTTERTRELKVLVSCEEGNLSCPAPRQ